MSSIFHRFQVVTDSSIETLYASIDVTVYAKNTKFLFF